LAFATSATAAATAAAATRTLTFTFGAGRLIGLLALGLVRVAGRVVVVRLVIHWRRFNVDLVLGRRGRLTVVGNDRCVAPFAVYRTRRWLGAGLRVGRGERLDLTVRARTVVHAFAATAATAAATTAAATAGAITGLAIGGALAVLRRQ
jgi:hypothetical protein